jgi:hypothetical protein
MSDVDFELTDEMAAAIKRVWVATHADRVAWSAYHDAKALHEAARAELDDAHIELNRVARPPRSAGWSL